jgi:hypothetical protein
MGSYGWNGCTCDVSRRLASRWLKSKGSQMTADGEPKQETPVGVE